MSRCGRALLGAGLAARLLLFVSVWALGWRPPAVYGQTWSDLLKQVMEANVESTGGSDSSQEQSAGVQKIRGVQWHAERELTADLSEFRTFEHDGERYGLWANKHVVLIQMSERSYRKLTDLKEMTWPLVKQATQDIAASVVTAIAPKHPYVAAALAGWSAIGDLYFIATYGADYWEDTFASSRVALYDLSGEGMRDRIDPGKAYSLGIFFKTSPFQCTWSSDGCWLDLELSLEVRDSFEYYLDAVEAARATNRPWRDACVGGYLPVIQEDGPACSRGESREPISFPIGSLRVEPGHYLIIPREPIVFDLPQSDPRTGETVQAFKKVQLSDSSGLFSRDKTFLIDVSSDDAEDSGEELRAGEPRTFDGIEFVWIPPGEFRMGSTSRHAHSDEKPVTRVRISRGFWLGKFEVTQRQWQSVMGSNPSHFKNCGGDCPVERVSWDDVQEFIVKLNARSGGRRYRLPTEAEWEYAARAGTTSDTYTGDLNIRGRRNAPLLDRIAWYGGNSGVSYDGGYDCSDWEEKQYRSNRCGTHPAGGKAPNAFGLHDMLGNVWEWVGDRSGDYLGGTVTDPVGPRSGSYRVLRGGGWGNIVGGCRSADRDGASPGGRNGHLGFRLLRK